MIVCAKACVSGFPYCGSFIILYFCTDFGTMYHCIM